jgi:hypothetical protein
LTGEESEQITAALAERDLHAFEVWKFDLELVHGFGILNSNVPRGKEGRDQAGRQK